MDERRWKEDAAFQVLVEGKLEVDRGIEPENESNSVSACRAEVLLSSNRFITTAVDRYLGNSRAV